LQADIDKIQEQVEQLDKKKFQLEEFFSLVDGSNPDMNSLREELSIAEEHIKKLQKKITSGDQSDERLIFQT
jgi:peptidoglycan hydrolase CwlO-like protein